MSYVFYALAAVSDGPADPRLERSSSPCAASTASAGTMPSTRSRWATTRTRSRRSSSRRTPTISSPAAASFPYPSATSDVHHEIELIVALVEGWREHPCREGARPRLRLCGRPRHDAARPAGRGEEDGPARGRSAKPSRLPRRAARSSAAEEVGHPDAGAIWLKVNGRRAQTGDLNQMIWKVPEAISYLSGLVPPRARRPHHDRDARWRWRGASAATHCMAISTASAIFKVKVV